MRTVKEVKVKDYILDGKKKYIFSLCLIKDLTILKEV